MVLPMTEGNCKLAKLSGTPRKATANVRIRLFTRTATISVSGPTQRSLREATCLCEIVDAMDCSPYIYLLSCRDREKYSLKRMPGGRMKRHISCCVESHGLLCDKEEERNEHEEGAGGAECKGSL